MPTFHCEHHQNKQIKIYCKNLKQMMCSDCYYDLDIKKETTEKVSYDDIISVSKEFLKLFENVQLEIDGLRKEHFDIIDMKAEKSSMQIQSVVTRSSRLISTITD